VVFSFVKQKEKDRYLMEQDALLITVLVFNIIIFLLMIELYRKVLSVISFYLPEAAPPLDLQVRSSFLPPKSPSEREADIPKTVIQG
jgi:hypothetical protein